MRISWKWISTCKSSCVIIRNLNLIKMVQQREVVDKDGNSVNDSINSNFYIELGNRKYPFIEEAIGGDESAPGSGWADKIKPPTNPPPLDPENRLKPNVTFTMDYCYGYRVR